jgi:sn-glycerol 3-phosphate transport system substrate-binding protein
MRENSNPVRRRGFIKKGAIALTGCTGLVTGKVAGVDSGEATGAKIGSAGGSSQTTTVDWWHAMSGALGQVLDDFVADFNEQSDGIRIETSFKGGYIETLNAVVAAVREGNQPAISQISVSETRTARDTGAFESAEAVMGDRQDFDEYLEPIAKGFEIDGEISALPFNNSNPIVYVNADMLSDAGYGPDDYPTSFQGMLETCRTVVGGGHAEFGIAWGNDPWFPHQWYCAMDQPVVNEQNGHGADPPTEMFLASEAGVRIYEWWRTLSDEGLYFNPGARATPGAQEAFNNEEVAMIIGSTAGLSGLAGETPFELETTRYPAPGGDVTGLSPGGAGHWLSADLDDATRDGAIEFLSWLSETEQQKRWHRETGYFPSTSAALSGLEDEGWFEENPNFRTAVDQLVESEVTNASRGYVVGPSPEIESQFIDFNARVLTTDRDVGVILEDAESRGESVLQDYTESRN